jgi:hypothetical protein
MVVGDGEMTMIGDLCHWVIFGIYFFLLLIHQAWRSKLLGLTKVVPSLGNVGLSYCVFCYNCKDLSHVDFWRSLQNISRWW